MNSIICIAGHIDHGKTLIVKQLTGVDTDRLPEEKERGMTIEIGFAKFNKDISFIDLPGHEKLIKNMVAGINGIDFALLVIAADDGVMPQTKEHLDILKLLGVKDIIFVLNKIDLVDEDLLELCTSEIEDFIEDNKIINHALVPVSAKENIGFEELKTQILHFASFKRNKTNYGIFRMPIDRTFIKQGFGTIVTGSIISGDIELDEKIEILPIKKTARIKNIQNHGKELKKLGISNRSALNLHGIEISDVKKGYLLSEPDRMKSFDRFVAKLDILPNREVRNNLRIRVHHGTNEVMARIKFLKNSDLCFIDLEKKLPITFKDKFIFRNFSPVFTIGGGTVLDTYYPRDARKNKDYHEQLAKIIDLEGNALVQEIIKKEFYNLPNIEKLIHLTGYSTKHLNRFTESLIQENKLIKIEDKHFIDINIWNDLKKTILFLIKSYLGKNKIKTGINIDELFELLESNNLFDKANFIKIINQFVEKNVLERKGNDLSIQGIKSSDERKKLTEKLLALLEKDGYKTMPPETYQTIMGIGSKSYTDVLSEAKKSGDIIFINREYILSQKQIETLKQLLLSFFKKKEELLVSDFRDLTNTSRKYSIPLLQHFENIKFLRRIDDVRVLY
ncbi:MAG: selenocysteine-specific translation elongation factor [Pseudomonadota bacterium]